MRDDPKVRAVKTEVRERERAIWSNVEKLGRELRAAEAPRAVMSQSDADVAKNRPKQGLGV